MTSLKHSAKRAAAAQWTALDHLRMDTRDLEVAPLGVPAGKIDSIGVVSADAGLVSVELAPFSLEFLFVADSRRRVHLAEFFPLTTVMDDLREIFDRVPVLQRFAARLCLDWPDFAALWGKQSGLRHLFPADVRLVADTLRELAEWAVCCELAETEAGLGDSAPRLMILHDGLLRSLLLRQDSFRNRLPEWWRRMWFERGVALAGIGKTSLVWQRLALALDLDERVQAAEQCYVPIPEKIEEAISGRLPSGPRMGFGRLVLLKTRLQSTGTYLPVDLPDWLLDDREATEQTLLALARASQTSFPRPGYPAPLGIAHEAAHLTDFDSRVIRDQVVEALRSIVEPAEFERMLRVWAFQPAQWDKAAAFGRP